MLRVYVATTPGGSLKDPPAPSSARLPVRRPLPTRPDLSRRASFSKVLASVRRCRTREPPPLGGGNQLDPDTSGSGEGRLDKTTYATLASSSMPASRMTGHFCWAFAQQPAESNAPVDRVNQFREPFFKVAILLLSLPGSAQRRVSRRCK